LQKLQAIECRRFAVILFLFCDKFSGYPVKLFLMKKKKNKKQKNKNLWQSMGFWWGFFFQAKDRHLHEIYKILNIKLILN